MNKIYIAVLLLLFLAAPAKASISRQGSCSGTTSCTPSSAAIGTVEYAFAYRSGSTTAATVPTSGCATNTQPCWATVFTDATSTGGTTGVLVVACRVDVSATAAASGTFTNAGNLGIVSYNGTGARNLSDCGLNLIPIGGNATNFAKTSNTVTFGGVTMSDGSGASWIVAAMGDSTTSNGCTPAGLTNVAGATTGLLSVDDTNAGVSSFSSLTCNPATGSTTWVSQTFEIVVRQAQPSIPSQLVQAYASLSNLNIANEAGNNFTFIAPDPAPAGNWIGFAIDWQLPGSCTSAASCHWTVTDNIGTNTYTDAQDCTFNDSTDALFFGEEIIYIQNVASGTQKYVFNIATFGNVIKNFSLKYINLKGIATTSSVRGTPVCSEGQTPAGNTLGNVTAGSLTGLTVGDVVWATLDSQKPATNQTAMDIMGGNGTLLTDAYSQWDTAQELTTTPGTSINPSFSFETAPGQTIDTLGTMAIALVPDNTKGGSLSGMKILTAQQDIVDPLLGTGTIQYLSFPCNSTTCLIVGEAGSTVANVFGAINSNPSQTWTELEPGGSTTTAQGFIWYDKNASADTGMSIIATGVTTTHGVATNTFALNIVGGDTVSLLDTLVSCGGSSTSDTPRGTCFNGSTQGTIGQATAATITNVQTSIPLTGNSTCNNGDFGQLDTGANMELVHITAGCGTSTLTVARADGTVAYRYTTNVAHAASVFLMTGIPGYSDAPTIKPSQGGGLVLLYGNNGVGPPSDIQSPGNLLQIWYAGEQDASGMGDGDQIGLWEPSSSVSQSFVYNLTNMGASDATAGSGTGWASAATSLLPGPTNNCGFIALVGVGCR